jgi:hypothetical protein
VGCLEGGCEREEVMREVMSSEGEGEILTWGGREM